MQTVYRRMLSACIDPNAVTEEEAFHTPRGNEVLNEYYGFDDPNEDNHNILDDSISDDEDEIEKELDSDEEIDLLKFLDDINLRDHEQDPSQDELRQLNDRLISQYSDNTRQFS